MWPKGRVETHIALQHYSCFLVNANHPVNLDFGVNDHLYLPHMRIY